MSYLRQGHNLTPPKKRPRTLQQRLDFLLNRLQTFPPLLLLLLALTPQNRVKQRIDLRKPGVDEKSDAGAREGAGGGLVAFGVEGGVWEGVGEEGGYDGGFGDDFVVEDCIRDFYGGDEAAGVYLVKIPFWCDVWLIDFGFGFGLSCWGRGGLLDVRSRGRSRGMMTSS